MVVPPKWMVFVPENPIRMDDLGVPPFMEAPHITSYNHHGFQERARLQRTTTVPNKTKLMNSNGLRQLNGLSLAPPPFPVLPA